MCVGGEILEGKVIGIYLPEGGAYISEGGKVGMSRKERFPKVLD